MSMDKIVYRYNSKNINSINEFCNIDNEVKLGYKDIYFVRLLGVNDRYLETIRAMDEKMNDKSSCERLYRRINKLPILSDIEKIKFYEECYNKWIISGKENVMVKSSEANYELQECLSDAYKNVMKLYIKCKKNASESMIKNFMIKLMYWFDALFEDDLISWNNHNNIKVVISNIVKEQEYLFCYMITLIGIDVLLLQYKNDIQINDELDKLSITSVLGEYKVIDIPEYTRKNNVIRDVETTNNNEEKIRVIIPPRHSRRSKKKQEEINNSNVQYVNNNNIRQASTSNVNVRREKSFEELALLADSIVMIAVHNKKGEIIGTGSGIMIGSDGYILTNYHVANKGAFYSVRIENDEEVYPTDELIKYNSLLDLAIMRIERRLKPIPIYRGREKLVRGQKVVAIGSPLGLFNSVSDGIISGFRIIKDVNMIQFTAPISQGSSGGAVLNMYGEVIGISTAGFDEGQNINLAVGYESINMFIKGFVN